MHAEHMVNVGEFYFYQTSAETTKYIFNDGVGATKDTCIVSVGVLPGDRSGDVICSPCPSPAPAPDMDTQQQQVLTTLETVEVACIGCFSLVSLNNSFDCCNVDVEL